jgi:hypothetical protein
VAAVAEAAAAVFGDPRNINNPSGGGGVGVGGVGGAMMGGALLAGTNNLLVNLNSASYSSYLIIQLRVPRHRRARAIITRIEASG